MLSNGRVTSRTQLRDSSLGLSLRGLDGPRVRGCQVSSYASFGVSLDFGHVHAIAGGIQYSVLLGSRFQSHAIGKRFLGM